MNINHNFTASINIYVYLCNTYDKANPNKRYSFKSVQSMIDFNSFTLNNGLRVIVHQDTTTPIVAMNLIYKVGSRDESPRRTGFAHLFEHLMFTGSKNIPKYDTPLEKAGGENNAFTNSDFTNYYLTIPKSNLEVGFWLESDRMKHLTISNNSLNIQKSVVIEEFKQNYLNQPYGDAYLLLKPLVYKKHPYRWSTIGKSPKHIKHASLQYVKNFYRRFYTPNNAILCIAGDVYLEEIKALSEKWFGDIKPGEIVKRDFEIEPVQKSKRKLSVKRDVNQNAIYIAFPMAKRMEKEYYVADLISDILSNGRSSRLYRRLVVDQQYFSEINAYITGEQDNGMLLIMGKMLDGITFDKAEKVIIQELNNIIVEGITNNELTKVKNKIESHLSFMKSSVLSKAMNLSYFEMLGDADLFNHEIDKYNAISTFDIQNTAANLFRSEKMNILTYKKAQ